MVKNLVIGRGQMRNLQILLSFTPLCDLSVAGPSSLLSATLPAQLPLPFHPCHSAKEGYKSITAHGKHSAGLLSHPLLGLLCLSAIARAF